MKDTVYSQHPQYLEMQEKWRRCRDCIAGEDSVKARGVEYLPRVGKTETDYIEYKKRASFYNAGGRTLMALLGALFRKPPQIELSEDLNYLIEECDDLTTPFPFFIRRIAREVLSVGRYGVLVDFPRNPNSYKESRPYFVGYPAERIIDWEVKNKQLQRIHIDLSPDGSVPGSVSGSVFGSAIGLEPSVKKLLVLELDESQNYRQRLYQREKGKWNLKEENVPKKEGKPLNILPFVMFSAVDLEISVKAPPLLDLVNVNLSHYRTHADLSHCLHFVALPTPYIISGSKRLKASEEPILLGSSQAWYLEEGSSVGMLEFSGAGVSALEEKLKRDELHMAHLGARLLEDPKRDAETAESLKIRQLGDHSILSMISQTVSFGIERLLDYAQSWKNPRTQAKINRNTNRQMNRHINRRINRIEINREFFEESISPQLLRELIQARQQGALDETQLKWNLQKAGILP